MSHNLVSQQISAQSVNVGQLEHNPNDFHSSMQMGFVGDHDFQQLSMPMFEPGVTDALTQQMAMPNDHPQPMEFMSNRNVPSNLIFSNIHMGQMATQPYNLASQQFVLPNKQSVVASGNALSQLGSRLAAAAKRKEPLEPTVGNSLSQKLSVTNKRVQQMDHRPWLQQMSTSNKAPTPTQSFSSTVVSQQSQAAVRRPASDRSGSQQQPVQKSQTRQLEASPKGQGGTVESVRSKLRESLAAALALVLQEQDKYSGSGKDPSGEDASVKIEKQENSQLSKEASSAADVGDQMSVAPNAQWQAEESLAKNCDIEQNMSTANFRSIEAANPSGKECQFNNIFHDGDVSYSENMFVKDELLQGNGLSWVLETNAMAGKMHVESAPEREEGRRSRPQAVETPEVLASKIEAELFKLFGGVNKKYKEKGRSLIFNLKDRNNPELRERVVFGEIQPERLCSMTAEELASKELSQWRIAKAEELAQMVVLPDSDGDMRRFVKKTHKGEVQVDIEERDPAAAEVSVGSSSLSQTREMSGKEVSVHRDPTSTEVRVNSGAKSSVDHKNVLTISSEGGDLMQGLMADDVLKDLPPIVSLDEFMESLNKEPPFEDLPVDVGKSVPASQREGSQIGSQAKSPVGCPNIQPVTTSKINSSDMAKTSSVPERKQVDTGRKLETSTSVGSGLHIWEGTLQLNVSSVASVTGMFKSGERTSTDEWPSSIEIKGRVRLDAFDKFIYGLPVSRSRAFMVVHFACTEGSAESERASLCEVTDSYVLDERVGYAEPASGVELYLCPPHSATQNMLSKVLSSDQLDALNAIDKGLIGVVVWRKPQSISPNSIPHYKHNSRKQNFASGSGKYHEKNNENVDAFTLKHSRDGPPPLTTAYPKSKPPVNDDVDDDDVPPGFGPPGVNCDDDDLPEFNFSSGSITPRSKFNPSMLATTNFPQSHAARPVAQIRELIQKYGQSEPNQTGTGVTTRRWNDDDDDDMPEWNPEETQRHQVQANPAMMPGPALQHTSYQQVAPQGIYQAASVPPHNMQGKWGAPPSGPYTNGQFSAGNRPDPRGMGWNRDAPTTRGF